MVCVIGVRKSSFDKNMNLKMEQIIFLQIAKIKIETL